MNALPVNMARNSPPKALCTWRNSTRLSRTSGRHPVKNLLTAIERSRRKRFQLGLEAAFEVLKHHGDQADIGDFVAHEGVAHELRPQRPQMHHARPADEGSDKTDHEIDGVIGGQNTQITYARPEGKQR